MEPSDPKLNTRVAGRYRLDERLGAGGMGVVYKGEDDKTGKPVAIKFLHEAFAGMSDLVKRFEREVTAMRRVRHPNVVGVVDSGVDGGVPYLVMDFQSGKSLGEVLDRGAIAPARAVGIAQQVLAGVAAAHKKGIVHRDLKPDNVMLLAGVEGDVVKILDFGLAKMVHGSTAGTQLTTSGFALGTPAYMAPEQAQGTRIDERADIYAVGVMLYHMVAGRKPFIADSPMAVLRMQMDDTPMPLRKAAPDARISAELEAAILRAMEKQPGKRWRSAEAFARALEATSEGGASKIPLLEVSLQELEKSRTALGRRKRARKPKAAPPRRAWLRRLPVAWIAKVALVAAIAIGGMLVGTRVWHRRHVVIQKVDSAVDGAKNALDRDRKQVLRKVDDAVGDAKSALQRDRLQVEHQVDSAVENAKSALHSLTTESTAGRDTPGAKLEAASRSRPAATPRKPVRLADATRLMTAGKLDDTIQALYQLRRQGPRSADMALLLGHAYFRKQWRVDGLREYNEALRLRPALRSNVQLVRNVVAALDDPTFSLAAALVRDHLGKAALGELRRAGQDAKNPRLQKRAARLAAEVANTGSGPPGAASTKLLSRRH